MGDGYARLGGGSQGTSTAPDLGTPGFEVDLALKPLRDVGLKAGIEVGRTGLGDQVIIGARPRGREPQGAIEYEKII